MLRHFAQYDEALRDVSGHGKLPSDGHGCARTRPPVDGRHRAAGSCMPPSNAMALDAPRPRTDGPLTRGLQPDSRARSPPGTLAPGSLTTCDNTPGRRRRRRRGRPNTAALAGIGSSRCARNPIPNIGSSWPPDLCVLPGRQRAALMAIRAPHPESLLAASGQFLMAANTGQDLDWYLAHRGGDGLHDAVLWRRT